DLGRSDIQVLHEDGPVKHARRPLIQPGFVDVLDHPDHLTPRVIRATVEPDTPAERIRRLCCDLSGKILGYEDHPATRVYVVPGHVSSGKKTRSHSWEVAGRDKFIPPLQLPAGRQHLAVDREAGNGSLSLDRQVA